jgi:hypothetical protein
MFETAHSPGHSRDWRKSDLSDNPTYRELAKHPSDCLSCFIAVAGVLLATSHDTLPRSTLDFRETQAATVPNR